MSIYEACDKLGTLLGSVSAPAAFSTVRVVPPGHGDDRHAARGATQWCNIEPLGEAREDENNDSVLVTYAIRFHAWYAKPNVSLVTAAQQLGTLAASCVAAIRHNSLGGWARYGIRQDEIAITYDTAGEGDLAYVVRGDVQIHRQE